MAVQEMGQHQLGNSRSVGNFPDKSGSSKQLRRQRSEPARLLPPRWQQDNDDGSPDVRMSGAGPQPQAASHIGKGQQGQTNDVDSSRAASNAGNNSGTAKDERVSDHPITLEIVPRVVQPVVSLSASTSEQEFISQEPNSETQNESLQPVPMADIRAESRSPQTSNGSESSSGSVPLRPSLRPPPPGRGPGPGPRSNKKHSPRPNSRDALTAPIQKPAISLKKEWQRILRLRDALAVARSELHFRRRLLKLKEEAKLVAVDRLIKHFHVMSANQSSFDKDESIAALLDDCQRARDEYGPLQDDYVILEDSVNLQEYQLRKAEDNFIERMSTEGLLPEGDDSSISSGDSDSASSVYTDLVSDPVDDCHPLVAEFLKKMGQVDILYERLSDNIDEKEDLEDEKEVRLRVGLPLHPDDQAFLDRFDQIEAELLGDIEIAQEEADKLQKQCLDYGLVDNKGNITKLRSQEAQIFRQEEEEGVTSGSERSEFTKFPDLLPKHGTINVYVKDPDPEIDEVVYNTDDRINHWLLIHLRSSPLDVSLLARTYEAQFGPIKGLDDWQKHVLTLWYDDGTRQGYQAYHKNASDNRSHPSAFLQQPESGHTLSPTLAPKVSPMDKNMALVDAPQDEILLIGLSMDLT